MESEKIKETNRVFYEVIENFDPNQIDMLVRKLTTYNNAAAQQSDKYVITNYEKYGDMIISCTNNEDIASITLKDFFYNLSNGVAKDILRNYSDFAFEDEDDLIVAYKAFITALKKFNWFDDNNINDECNIRISYKDKIVFDGRYSELKNDFEYAILELSDLYFYHNR